MTKPIPTSSNTDFKEYIKSQKCTLCHFMKNYFDKEGVKTGEKRTTFLHITGLLTKKKKQKTPKLK